MNIDIRYIIEIEYVVFGRVEHILVFQTLQYKGDQYSPSFSEYRIVVSSAKSFRSFSTRLPKIKVYLSDKNCVIKKSSAKSALKKLFPILTLDLQEHPLSDSIDWRYIITNRTEKKILDRLQNLHERK